MHICGREKPADGDASTTQRSGIRPPRQLRPSACRKSFSMGHMCDKFGHTEIEAARSIHLSSKIGEPLANSDVEVPNVAHEAQPLADVALSNAKTQYLPIDISLSPDTPDIERWRWARDIFSQYNVNRPSGWLSDVDDLFLSGDGNASPQNYSRYCHVCSCRHVRTTPACAPVHCSSCGHRMCSRCICETSSGNPRSHASASYQPSPTITRDESLYVSTSGSNLGYMQQTPHREATTANATSDGGHQDHVSIEHRRRPRNFRSDHGWRKTEERGEKLIPIKKHATNIGVDGPKRMEIRHTRSFMDNPFIISDRKGKVLKTRPNVSPLPATPLECNDPICRATHTGHYPFRHSVSCSKHGYQPHRRVLAPESAWNQSPQASALASEKVDSDTTHTPVREDIVHQHDLTRARHSNHHSHHHPHHVLEHPPSAADHSSYNRVEKRSKKRAPADTSGRRKYDVGDGESTIAAADTTWTSVPVQTDSDLSLRYSHSPKGLFTSTSPWPKKAGKQTADNAHRLHHIGTKADKLAPIALRLTQHYDMNSRSDPRQDHDVGSRSNRTPQS